MKQITDRQRTYILRMVQDCRRYANQESPHGAAIMNAATNFTSNDIPMMTVDEASAIIDTLQSAMEVFGANEENVMKAKEAIDTMRFEASMEIKVTQYD